MGSQGFNSTLLSGFAEEVTVTTEDEPNIIWANKNTQEENIQEDASSKVAVKRKHGHTIDFDSNVSIRVKSPSSINDENIGKHPEGPSMKDNDPTYAGPWKPSFHHQSPDVEAIKGSSASNVTHQEYPSQLHQPNTLNSLSKSVSPVSNHEDGTSLGDFMCSYCGIAFELQYQLEQHESLHISRPNTGSVVEPKAPNDQEKRTPLDEESRKGRYGWFDIDRIALPFIFRHGTEKYTSVRMVEQRLLNKYLQVLLPEVKSCICIRSYYITDAECKLLNEIRKDCIYGKEAFTNEDLMVCIKDVEEFQKFLAFCRQRLVLRQGDACDPCGFLNINGMSVVSYIMKEGIKYVPLFYFANGADLLKLKSKTVKGWDLTYLKFCCKVQGVPGVLFPNEICSVVALEEIMNHFPVGTTFKQYWPTKGNIKALPDIRASTGVGNWVQRPAGQPDKMQNNMAQIQPYGLQSLGQQSALYGATAATAGRGQLHGKGQMTTAQLQQFAVQQSMTNDKLLQLMRLRVLNNLQHQQQAHIESKRQRLMNPGHLPVAGYISPCSNQAPPQDGPRNIEAVANPFRYRPYSAEPFVRPEASVNHHQAAPKYQCKFCPFQARSKAEGLSHLVMHL